MADPYGTLAKPEGTVQEIEVKSSVMTTRYRDAQPAINKPSQDTLPNRE